MLADEETCQRVRLVLVKAAARGSDPVRALNELGLLWSAGRVRKVAADSLSQAADLLGQTSVGQLPGGKSPATALDTKRRVQEWLHVQAQEMLQP